MAYKLPLLFTALIAILMFAYYPANAGKLTVNSSMPITGNVNGEYQLVEFFDYNCSYCKKMVPVLEKIAQNHPKTQIVMIEYPIFGEESEMMAKAALAVHKTQPTKYFEFHKKLMAHRGDVDEKVIASLAESIGVSGAALVSEMKKSQYDKFLSDNREIGRKYGVRSTPNLLIDGYNAKGAISYDSYRKYYEEVDK